MGGVERIGSPALRVWRLAVYLAFTLVLAAIVGHELVPLIGRSRGKIELVAPHDRN